MVLCLVPTSPWSTTSRDLWLTLVGSFRPYKFFIGCFIWSLQALHLLASAGPYKFFISCFIWSLQPLHLLSFSWSLQVLFWLFHLVFASTSSVSFSWSLQALYRLFHLVFASTSSKASDWSLQVPCLQLPLLHQSFLFGSYKFFAPSPTLPSVPSVSNKPSICSSYNLFVCSSILVFGLFPFAPGFPKPPGSP